MEDDAEKHLPEIKPEKAERPEHLEVLPIELEAVENAYHIHLSWRSWVRISSFSKHAKSQ
jgi:hypothetical protein